MKKNVLVPVQLLKDIVFNYDIHTNPVSCALKGCYRCEMLLRIKEILENAGVK